MELLAHEDPVASGRGTYASCWGYTAPDGTELALLATFRGIEIYDVTDPQRPRWMASIAGPVSQWREMQTWSHYAYVVTEGTGGDTRGVQIVDLGDPSNPRAPRFVGAFDSTFVTAHTIHIADGFAYVNGTNNGWRILDLADPVHPRDVGGWDERYVHDCFVRGNRAYLANISDDGFTILDVSDKSNPVEIGFQTYDGASTHNCWTTDDGDYLFTTDETPGGHLRVWDVREPTAVVEVAAWSANPLASIHNVVVRGDSAYISYYTEGVQVLDVSRPGVPERVGFYDTYPGASGGFNGNWAVYPLSRSGAIYASDIQGGLFVLRLTGDGPLPVMFRLDAPPAQLVQPGQSLVWLYFDLFNEASSRATFNLAASHSAGWSVTVQPSIAVAAAGVERVLVTTQVPPGLSMPVRAEVELCATQTPSGGARCARADIAVPVLLQALDAEVATDGVRLRWRLEVDAGGSGRLEVLRAQVAGPDAVPAPDAFASRAILDLTASDWLDRDVAAGAHYVYRLALLGAAEARVLGETRVAVAAASRSRLLGAAPNPFNPTTTIRFELARAGAVGVAIHDARGRLVRRLEAARMEAGARALAWDGRDMRGRAQPSGLYLYEVRSGAWTAHGRMTLAK